MQTDLPVTWLGAATVQGRTARLTAARHALGRHGPAVSVASTRDRATRLADPSAAPDVRALARTRECVRRTLLDHYGELLTQPCGHCSSET